MTTPNMGLVLPSVGVTIGPTWASELNAALEAVDAHDHTPGNGVSITPEAITIDSALPFNGNAADTVGRVALVSQAVTSALPCNVYVVAGDLWYTNASGTAVQLTVGGSPAAGGGSISGMTGTTASAVYNNATKAFEWNQASGLRATLDAGAVQLRQAGVSSAASVSLAAPTTGVTSYTLTLPATAPATVGRFLFASTAGAASWVQPDASTVEVSGTTLQVKALGIGTAQLAALSVTTAKIAAGAVGTSQIGLGAVTGGISVTSPTGSIAYRTIVTENLAELAVTGAKIDLATITSANLANNAVTLGKIAAGAVADTNLVTNAVTTVKITDLNVTTAKLADLAVTTAKINDLAVTSGKIAAGAVTSDKLGWRFSTANTGAPSTTNSTTAVTLFSVTGFTTYEGIIRACIQPRPGFSAFKFIAYNFSGAVQTLTLTLAISGAVSRTFYYSYDIAAGSALYIPPPNIEANTVPGTIACNVTALVSAATVTLYYENAQLFVQQGD